MIFTTANDSLNLAHRPFDVSNLEKWEHKNFLEKQFHEIRAENWTKTEKTKMKTFI